MNTRPHAEASAGRTDVRLDFWMRVWRQPFATWDRLEQQGLLRKDPNRGWATYHFAVLPIGTAFLRALIDGASHSGSPPRSAAGISLCMACWVLDCSHVTLTPQATDRRSAGNLTARSKDSDGRDRGCTGDALFRSEGTVKFERGCDASSVDSDRGYRVSGGGVLYRASRRTQPVDLDLGVCARIGPHLGKPFSATTCDLRHAGSHRHVLDRRRAAATRCRLGGRLDQRVQCC